MDSKNHLLHKVVATTPAGLSSPAVHIPPTPFLKRLGYGTGVDVFLFERSPAKNGIPFSPWALKRVQKKRCEDPDITRRLEEEATVLKRLKHPNIIGYRGYKTLKNGNKVLAMEDGQQSLMDLIEEMNEGQPEPFMASTIEKVIYSCAKALSYLHHDMHLMHGDLKSGNILIKNMFEEIKLCDFGVTVPLDQNGQAMEDHEYVGTDLWSAPEVINGDTSITNKADIFALGMVIYEMLSLQFPHMNPRDDSSLESDDNSLLEEEDELELGTRPALPEDFDYDDSYKRILEIYFTTTQEESEKRPDAREIVELFEENEQKSPSETSTQ